MFEEEWDWERVLRRDERVLASVVFPEPGMPDTATRRRWLGGVCWNFS